MKISKVLMLDGSVIASEDEFGNKTAVISRLSTIGVSVPIGFCVAFSGHHSFGTRTMDEVQIRSIRDALGTTLNSSSSGKCIVRSSMSLEDNPVHQFPGVFSSVPEVDSLESLSEAFDLCVESRNTAKARAYASHFGIRFDLISVAILVQEQIVPRLSGLAHLHEEKTNAGGSLVDHLEVTRGPMSNLIEGRSTPSAFQLKHDGSKKMALKALTTNELRGVQEDDLYPYLRDLASNFAKIRKALRKSTIVEFAIDGDGVKILQARPPAIVDLDPLRPFVPPEQRSRSSVSTILEDEEKYGLKGAAMRLFKKLGLFSEPLLLFDPGTPLFEIQKGIKDFDFGDKGITVRYSQGDEIGLPRIFCRNKDVAFERITDTYRTTYFTIMHSYMNINRSFELLIDEDYLVLEHVPGLWEASNTLEPDVMILDGDEATILRVRDKRTKIISTPNSNTHILEEPIPIEALRRWFTRVVALCDDTIKPRLRGKMPLNLHFVETESGDWSFLNIRRMVRLSKRYVRGGSFFHVRSLDDLKYRWDQKTPILLKLSIPRGSELDLIALAEALPRDNTEVFICFGYLSHPALLLREFGVNIVPAYGHRDLMNFTYERAA